MRNTIRDELLSIVPLDDLEQSHIADALEWIDSGAQLYRLEKPATPPKHLVSYCVVVDDGHLLLVDHRNAQLWLPPGGHVESDEHPRDTVTRELAEELNLVPTHPICLPLMVTVTTTVGLSAGHVDVSLWYIVNADKTLQGTSNNLLRSPLSRLRCSPYARTAPLLNAISGLLATVFRGPLQFQYDDKEFQSIKWFPFHKVPFERTDPHLRRLLSKLSVQEIL